MTITRFTLQTSNSLINPTPTHCSLSSVKGQVRADHKFGWHDTLLLAASKAVSELAVVGVPAILIPYPWHVDKQQYRNAQWLCAAQAAEWFEQTDLRAEQLAARLDYWNDTRPALIDSAQRAWQLGIRDSAERIVKVVQDVIESRAL